jgi:3-deoxy-manno-octulosonate cytidylyltransferase (CMP-KDO synthetase)
MKIIAMIPARFSASRFPGKLLQDLGGQTVISRTYMATQQTGLFSDVYVVTDSKNIADEIHAHGGKVIMSKASHESGSDRIAEAVTDIDCDIVVNVQGDEPFTDRSSLEKLIGVFEADIEKQIDLASLMVKTSDEQEINNPNTVKVIVDQQDFALYFSRSPIPYARNTNIEPSYFKHIGIYAFRKQAIIDFSKLEMTPLEASEKIECIRFLEHSKKIKMVETHAQSIGIDTPEDLERAKQLLKQ